MLRTSSIIFLLVFGVSVKAQNDSIPKQIKDSTTIKLQYGLRLGIDIGKLIRTSIDDEFSGIEVSGDFRIKKRLYIAGEIGIEEKKTVNDYLDITSNGTYLKAGIDYNAYDNWLDIDNMIYFGFRVGASTFSHDLNSATVYTTNQYWSPQLTLAEKRSFSGLTAIWTEVQLGMKAELFNNFYMGLNVQLKVMGTQSRPDNFENVYIPGFGKTYDSSFIGAGYSYFLSYRIPLYKKDN